LRLKEADQDRGGVPMLRAVPFLLAIVYAFTAEGCGRDAAGPAASPESAAPVATDQGDSADDLALTKRIRQSIMADDRLSSLAKNVAIITVQGRVTLRGRAPSARDKAEIGVRARQIAGATNVDNLIEVKAEAAKK
jgi:osmotically-inducible protein OsmY